MFSITYSEPVLLQIGTGWINQFNFLKEKRMIAFAVLVTIVVIACLVALAINERRIQEINLINLGEP